MSGMYKVYGKVGVVKMYKESMLNDALIRCYLGRCRQAQLLFLYILQLGLHVHRPSIGPEELDTVQYVLLCLCCW